MQTSLLDLQSGDVSHDVRECLERVREGLWVGERNEVYCLALDSRPYMGACVRGIPESTSTHVL